MNLSIPVSSLTPLPHSHSSPIPFWSPRLLNTWVPCCCCGCHSPRGWPLRTSVRPGFHGVVTRFIYSSLVLSTLLTLVFNVHRRLLLFWILVHGLCTHIMSQIDEFGLSTLSQKGTFPLLLSGELAATSLSDLLALATMSSDTLTLSILLSVLTIFEILSLAPLSMAI